MVRRESVYETKREREGEREREGGRGRDRERERGEGERDGLKGEKYWDNNNILLDKLLYRDNRDNETDRMTDAQKYR